MNIKRKREFILKMVHHYNVNDAREYTDIPEPIRRMLEAMPTHCIVRPLILRDREKGLSIRAIATRYNVTVWFVRATVEHEKIACDPSHGLAI